MNTVPRMISFARARAFALVAGYLVLASGCSALRSVTTPAPPPPSFYSLGMRNAAAAPASAVSAPLTAPTLVVSTPSAAAGFDSQHIMYVRQPHQLEYFAQSECTDPPARMLSPLIVAAMDESRVFSAVVHTPSSGSGDLRLDTEVLRLQHEFLGQPSQVRFTLRASLVEDTTRRVIATREFESIVAATSEDAYGGVVAANQAVRAVLENLAAFCAQAAAAWRPAGSGIDSRPAK